MKNKIIKTEQEYNAACELIYTLINSSESAIDPESSEGEEIELLSLLVEKYEQEHYPIELPDRSTKPDRSDQVQNGPNELKTITSRTFVWRKDKGI